MGDASIPPAALEIRCSGTRYEIGHQHGAAAKAQVAGSLTFYKDFFQHKANLTWPEACTFATQFLPMLEIEYPQYLEEMRGIADGAEVDFQSILALNVRTEIGYGLATDGCTAFGVFTPSTPSSTGSSYLAQNWDWDVAQSPNIIALHITLPPSSSSSSSSSSPHTSDPALRLNFMTEAGLLAKTGLNSAGVAVTLNAIPARGVSTSRLPCHLALRTVLESRSRADATQRLLRLGVASSCHIQVADADTGGVGLEWSAFDVVVLGKDEGGRVAHSNHFVGGHVSECVEGKALPDSGARLQRIKTLLGEEMKDGEMGEGRVSVSMKGLRRLLMDEENYPTAICRARMEGDSLATLFSVVMDLRERVGVVKMGRPTEGGQEIELRP